MARHKRSEPEYRLNIFYRKDPQTKQRNLVFLFRTIQEFVSFHYEILVEDKLVDRTLHLKIAGLNAPSSLMPATGPALGRKEYNDLNGTYTVEVKKLDGTTNEFQLDISREGVRILESPKHPIILISTDPVVFA